MMKRVSVYTLFTLLIASLLLAACAGPAQAPQQAQPGQPERMKVRVATDATWFPFEFVDEQTQEIVGFDIDLIKAIAEKENLDIELLNVSWDPLLAGMAQCQYDASISAMTITEERKQSFLFSDPYFAAGQQVVVRADNTNISGVDDLVGKTAGAQLGTTGAIELETMEGVTLRAYDEIGLAFQDLMNGQIDAVVADDALAQGFIGRNPTRLKSAGESFTAEYYGIAVCKTNTALVERLNRGLAALEAEGYIDQLVEKWLISE
jgi:polar amino acid transport system substrate-binding protein